MSMPSQSSLETASERSFTSSSSRSNTPNQLDHDSDDPSFDLTHIQTSTPLRPTRHKPRGDEDDPLHASDTESLDLDEDDIDRALGGRRGTTGVQGDPLTRRRLLELSGGAASTRSFGASSGGATPLALPNGQLFSRGVRSDIYAPSPSTGSSTLVDRDEELAAQHSLSRYSKADETLKARERRQSTLREEREEEEAADEEGTVMPSVAGGSDQERDESSSSPRPRRRRTGQLASYVDAKMSAAALNATPSPPRRSPKSRRLLSASSTSAVPPTPAAPGAYPPSARKPVSSTSLQPSPPWLSSSFRRSHSSTSPSSAAQVHDIFARHITGPDGALTHAAERRAALSTSTSHPESHSFVPSSSLPVERDRDRKGKRRAAAQAEEDSSEPLAATRQPQKGELEWALKHLSHAQERSVDLDEYLRASVVRGSSAAAGFSTKEDEEDEQLQAGVGAGQRSAIDFAMQRSFAAARGDEDASAEDSFSDDQDLRQSAARRRATTATLRASTSHSVRFASPPAAPSRSRSRSPSPTPSPPEPRPASAPSAAIAPRRSSTPPLPPLPPPILPESPEPARVQPRRTSFLRRSQSFEAPRYEREDREERREREERRLERVEEAPLSPPSPREENRASPAKSSRRSSSRSQPEPAPSSSQLSSSAARSSPPRSRSYIPAPQPASAAPLAAEQPDPSSTHSLPHLVSQLSSAVRALTAAQTSPSPSPHVSPSSSPPQLNDQGLPRPHPADEERDGLKHQLVRRRKESDRKRRELESELREMERRGASEGEQRAAMLEQLAETYVVEHELGCKVDELRKSIEGMGQLVGDQVASVVGETIREDTKRRAHWLVWVLGLQVLLFLLFLRLANSRLSSLYPSMYHDPFAPPALFHLPPHVFSLSSSPSPVDYLSPETLAAFAPVPPTSNGFNALGGALGGARRWLSALLAQAARVAPVASAPPVRSPFVAVPV